MIISLISAIFFGLYAALDAVSNIDFVLQKIGLNEQAANFLGSTRGIYFLFFVSLVALAISMYYQLRKYEDFYHRLESGYNQQTINHPVETVIQTKTEPTNEKPAKKSLPKQKSDAPPVINVDPAYLTGFFEEHTTIQANKLLESYIGKRIKISGIVLNVSTSFDDTVVYFQIESSKTGVNIANFSSPQEIEHAQILKRGQNITVIGQIKRVNSNEIDLENCELIDE